MTVSRLVSLAANGRSPEKRTARSVDPGARTKWLTAAATALVVTGSVALASCSSAPGPGKGEGGTRPTSATSSATTRCDDWIPPGAIAKARALRGSRGERISTLEFPTDDATTTLVLVHQTGPLGACGWGRFASAAQRRGVASIAVDLCGYGETVCGERTDTADVLRTVVESARVDRRDVRVVLVGASMGGYVVTDAVADGIDVDAWADLSGPDRWGGAPLSRITWSPDVGLPGLVMYGADEPSEEIRAARRLAQRSGARFELRPEGGHGYELLTDHRARLLPGGRTLLAFASEDG